MKGVTFDRDQCDDRGCNRVWPHRRAQRESAGRPAGAVGRLQHEIAARMMHPVENLDARVDRDAGERLAPAFIHHDGADRSFQAAALGAVFPPMPRRVDRADEVNAGVRLCRQNGCRLSFAQYVVGHWGTVTGFRGWRPVARADQIDLDGGCGAAAQ